MLGSAGNMDLQGENRCQRWWEVSKDWKSFVRTAEELRRRTLIRDVDTKKVSPLLEEMVNAQSKAAEARREENEGKREAQDLGSHMVKPGESTNSG